MKRFKKLTIYLLVGIIVSSSVMMTYKKAEEVKASVALTVSTGALLMLGILGAYGIVYKGSIDSSTEQYIWKGDRGLYPHEVEEAEEWWAQMWDNTVRNYATNNGYDPDDWNDEENDLETQPPLWEKFVDLMPTGNVNEGKQLMAVTSAVGLIANTVVNAFKNEAFENTNVINSIVTTSPVLESSQDYVYGFDVMSNDGASSNSIVYKLSNVEGDNVRPVIVQGVSSSGSSAYGLVLCSKSPFSCDWGTASLSTTGTEKNFTSIDTSNLSMKSGTSVSKTLNNNTYYYFFKVTYNTKPSHVFSSNLPIVLADSPLDTNLVEFLEKVHLSNFNFDSDLIDTTTSIINNNNIGYGTNTSYSDNGKITPILPYFYMPNNSMIENLLNNLETNIGNEEGTQNAVDTFVESLDDTQTNPDTGGDTGGNTNPDTGEQGGTGGDTGDDTDEDNSMFLADLKLVFPFCIPFDLIDCFKLFNAEPVTPRVEIPLHFGIVDKDYTFVIDLEDFNGVAQVCRTMFLIMFIVGLVMSTRSLIRG